MERVALLTEVKKKKRDENLIKAKMQRTFSLRRQEVLQEPKIPEFFNKWPALLDVTEIKWEFMRLTTVPLTSKFLGELDRLTNDLIGVFNTKGGVAGKKIGAMMAKMENDMECSESEADVAGTTMAIYTVQAEGDDHDGPGGLLADVGVVLEGVEVLHNLQSINHACVMLYGLIYALNLSYPRSLKNIFEAYQKILMDLESSKLSPKVRTLKLKLLR
ncbi:uncharacterized protein LOC119776938 isoform X3 [Cyprinodon tularosa]|uniref:uncharacterized protein LOC119776938 isoform X3 n=1 Tax=Cyprinodon tularosa TaxID=77115 RepID=UPI0018E26203|nr:uncharacterized protein LOC119776938 isoform X3 [Cyprinodon tularosa]